MLMRSRAAICALAIFPIIVPAYGLTSQEAVAKLEAAGYSQIREMTAGKIMTYKAVVLDYFAFALRTTRRVVMAPTVRFSFRAIKALSIFDSSNAKSCPSSSGVHGRPLGRGPSLPAGFSLFWPRCNPQMNGAYQNLIAFGTQ